MVALGALLCSISLKHLVDCTVIFDCISFSYRALLWALLLCELIPYENHHIPKTEEKGSEAYFIVVSKNRPIVALRSCHILSHFTV